MTLSDKYRPKTLSDVVGQEKIITILRRLESTGGFGGRAIWIQGKSGSGKSSTAKIIAQQVAGTGLIEETTGRQLTLADMERYRDQWHSPCLFGGYALIVNEAHGLRKPIIEVFLNWLESLRSHCCVIFTTTNDGADLFEEHVDSGAFASRCLCLRFTSQGVTPAMAKRVREIAQAENLDGRPESAYKNLIDSCNQNMREALNKIESGCMLA